jgi:hypothetical protein
MYEPGTPYYGERSWFRRDKYIPTGNYDLVFVIGPDDHSPIHKYGYEVNHAGYDARCSCCWLGFAHSEEYHEQAIIEAALKIKKYSQIAA